MSDPQTCKMRRSLLLFASLLVSFTCLLTSCQEHDEPLEYENWQVRNERYIDSIARVAQSNPSSWTRLHAYTYSNQLSADADNSHYVYVQKLESGSGDYQPLFNDSVRIHYEGRLIASRSYPEGRVFDKSFLSTVADLKTDVPSLFGVSGMVIGVSTALMHMVEGDHWRVYVPWALGYGKKSSSTSIPDYSTLIFDIRLAKIYRFQVDKDTSWH